MPLYVVEHPITDDDLLSITELFHCTGCLVDTPASYKPKRHNYTNQNMATDRTSHSVQGDNSGQ